MDWKWSKSSSSLDRSGCDLEKKALEEEEEVDMCDSRSADEEAESVGVVADPVDPPPLPLTLPELPDEDNECGGDSILRPDSIPNNDLVFWTT